MAEKNKKESVFSVICPCCDSVLWIDRQTGEVLRYDKPAKKKGSLDDMLAKEQKRKSGFERKFDAEFELQREKRSRADELFKKALEKAEKGEDEDG